MYKILVNGWGEKLHKPFGNFVKSLRFDRLHDFCNYNDYTSYFNIKKIIKNGNLNYDIIDLNCWPDLFFLKKDKKINYIFESHGFHPGTSFKYSLLIIENKWKKLIITILYPFFYLIYKKNIKKLGIYYVAQPGLHNYLLQRGIKNERLPIAIDMQLFCKTNKNNIKLDKNYINIFYPNGLRKVKNSEYALKLMIELKNKYKNCKFYMINSHGNQNKYKTYLNILKKDIIWFNPFKRTDMPGVYSSDWDLILGDFYPEKNYSLLNTMECEAMACKSPMLCCDLNEVIFEPLEKLEDLAYKIIEDKEYRNWYIERNYEYIMKVHSCEAVAKIYEEDIKELMKK